MKFLILVLFSIISLSILSQSIRFQLYIKSPCNEKIYLALNRNIVPADNGSYFLTNVSNKSDTQYWNNDLGIIYLPDTGNYQIHVYENNEADLPVMQIKDTGFNTYTYKEPKIIFRCLGDPGCFYYKCDSLANGYQEDYYKNGVIRIRGDFLKGQIKDSVVTYYLNGVIEKRIMRLDNETIINEFDSASNLKRYDRNFNIHGWSFDNETKEYFSNGSLKSNSSRIKNIFQTEEYYKNGSLKIKQTKKSRIEYFENGEINVKYYWKFKKDRDYRHDEWGTCKIYRNEFDKDGKLIEQQVYEEFGNNVTQPNLNIQNSDWIDLGKV